MNILCLAKFVGMLPDKPVNDKNKVNDENQNQESTIKKTQREKSNTKKEVSEEKITVIMSKKRLKVLKRKKITFL